MSKQGTTFTNAYTASPLCSPSRSCMAVGKYYDRVNIISNHQNHPFDDPTFYELLRDQGGYHTMTCGKLDLRHPEHSYGNDGKHIVDGIDYLAKWGFSDGVEIGGKLNGAKVWRTHPKKADPYILYLNKLGIADAYAHDSKKREFADAHAGIVPDEAYVDNWIGRCGLELLKNAPRNQPWFIQVNFNSPHSPLDATEKMLRKWQDIEFPLPINSTRFTVQENQTIRRNYAAMIENIDSWIQKFIEIIEDRGELDNTIIIFASDHGEMLGDHNRVAKSVPYQGAIHIPLLIAGKRIKNHDICSEPVSLIDLFATFLDYAEIELPKDVDSHSLKPKLDGKSMNRGSIHSGLSHFRLIIENNFKLVIGYGTRKNWRYIFKKKFSLRKKRKEIYFEPIALYDLDSDPEELHNIAEKRPDIVKRLIKTF